MEIEAKTCCLTFDKLITGINGQHFECWLTVAVRIKEKKSKILVGSADSSATKTKLDSCESKLSIPN